LEHYQDKEKKMSKVSLMIGEKAVTIAFDGKLETIMEGDVRYPTVMSAIRAGATEELPRLLDTSRMFEHIRGVELVNGRIQINGKTIPDNLTKRVLNFRDKGLPFEPLLKFSEKLLENPSFNSRQMLYNFLEHEGHPLTMEGNFIAYKAVRKNFKDIHTGTMSNDVGKTVSMPRDQVDDNPNNTCSSGLHVAAYKYAKDFGSGGGGSIILEVEINPRDVVAVPNDYNGQKMRVCQYVVRRICEDKLEDVDLYEETREITYGDLVVRREERFNPIGTVQAIVDGTAIVGGKTYAVDDLEAVEVDEFGNTADYYGFYV
jgi:hypothetical protein